MRTLLAGLISLALGLVAAFAGVLHRAPTPWLPRPGPGPVGLWVADRAGGVIHGLDQDLFPVRALEVPCPVAVVGAGSGRLWVASALQDTRWGHHALALLNPDGQPIAGLPTGTVQSLHASHAGGVFVHHLDRDQGRAVLDHITVGGLRTHIDSSEWFDAIGSRGRQLLVATQDGWLTGYDLDHGSVPACEGAVPGPVSAIVAQPNCDDWWVAWRAPPRAGDRKWRGRLSRVTLVRGAQLEISETLRMPFLVRALLVSGPHLWALELDGARAQRIQVGTPGPHPIARLLDGPPVGAVALAGPEAGCIVFTAEALLALDGDTTCRTTQGMFQSISSVTSCTVDSTTLDPSPWSGP